MVCPKLLFLLTGQKLIFSETSTTVTESNDDSVATSTYTVRLASQPTFTVLMFFSDAFDDFTANNPVTQFSTSNWNVPATVTIKAVNDDVDEDTETFMLPHTLSSADTTFNEAVEYTNITIIDDDTGLSNRPAACE